MIHTRAFGHACVFLGVVTLGCLCGLIYVYLHKYASNKAKQPQQTIRENQSEPTGHAITGRWAGVEVGCIAGS